MASVNQNHAGSPPQLARIVDKALIEFPLWKEFFFMAVRIAAPESPGKHVDVQSWNCFVELYRRFRETSYALESR